MMEKFLWSNIKERICVDLKGPRLPDGLYQKYFFFGLILLWEKLLHYQPLETSDDTHSPKAVFIAVTLW